MSSRVDTAEEAAAAASLSRSRQALQDAAQQLFWDASEVDEAGLALAADLAAASATLAAERTTHASSAAASAQTIAQLRRSLAAKDGCMQLLEGALRACRSELAGSTEELARVQGEVSDLRDEVEQLTDVIDENNEFTNHLREEHEELQFRATDNMEREGPACVQAARLRGTLAQERAEVSRSRARVAELECRLAEAAASRELWSGLDGERRVGRGRRRRRASLGTWRSCGGWWPGGWRGWSASWGRRGGVSEGLRVRLAAAQAALEAEEQAHGSTQGMAKLRWKAALVTRERYEEEFNDYNKEQRDKWDAWRLEFDAYKGAHTGPRAAAPAPPPLPVTATLPAHLANPPPLPHQRPHPKPLTQSEAPAAAPPPRPPTGPAPPGRDGQRTERKVKPARLSPEDARSLFGAPPPPHAPAPPSPPPSVVRSGRGRATTTHPTGCPTTTTPSTSAAAAAAAAAACPATAETQASATAASSTGVCQSTAEANATPRPRAPPQHLRLPAPPDSLRRALRSRLPLPVEPAPSLRDMTAFANAHPPALDATTGVKALKLYLTQSGVKESTMRALTYKSELLALALTRGNAWEVRRIQACSAIVVADEDDYVTCEAEAYAAVFRVPESFFLGEGKDGREKVHAQAVRDAFNKLRLMVHPDNNSPEDLEEAKRACSFLGFAYMHIPA
ncbi:MAG: hypothetical protein WDW36_007115 [Sanguina aurantia]